MDVQAAGCEESTNQPRSMRNRLEEQMLPQEESVQSPANRRRGEFSLGVFLIVVVACVWVAASQLIESIFKDLAFDKPFFLTYFNTCGFSFWLLAPFCSRQLREELRTRPGDSSMTLTATQGCASSSGVPFYMLIALSICPGWMIANYLFNLSLDMTSVASNSVLSTTSNLWTMLFSFCVLGERVDPFKVIAVAITVGGATLVATSDRPGQDGKESTVLGDMLALASACAYGGYSVLLKYMTAREGTSLSMSLVFGFVGLLVMLLGWPVLLILAFFRLEPFEWPNMTTLGYLALNAAIGTNLSDMLWAKALQLTSPLVATLGLSLTIPLGMLSDMALHGHAFPAPYITGSCLVLLGFMLGAAAEKLWYCIRRKLCMRNRMHDAVAERTAEVEL